MSTLFSSTRRIILIASLAIASIAPLPQAAEPPVPAPAAKTEAAGVTPDQALQRLVEGNKRYIKDSLSHPNQTAVRRTEVAKGQHPFAIILGCSDSRVAPELLFDQGIGDLFVVRVAGNIVTDQGIGSIEYAVEHLHANLIIVLGHAKCGAVTAAVGGGHAPGRIHTLLESLEPAVKAAQGKPGDAVALVTQANVDRGVHILNSMQPILEERVKTGTVKVVGAIYNVETGQVDFLP